MIRFSIIVPLYNKAPYVCKALDSIMFQTFTDWECIIVDDGSTDGSVAIVQDYLSTHYTSHITHKNMRIISQSNSGVAKARNVGVENSLGEYLCFLDADDWWEPNYLEEMDKLIKEYPNAGIYCTNYIYYKPGKTHVALKLERGYMNYPDAYLHSVAMPVWTGATCMSRKVFDEMGGFPIGIKLGEDFLLWAKTAIKYKVAFCEKPLAYYNNDVPASLRATRNLHAPEHHMLFLLDTVEDEITHSTFHITHSEEWKALLDMLRVKGLLKYWMDDTYHKAAEEELKKVNWTKQPRSVRLQYKLPIWMLKINRNIRTLGSFIKQKFRNR